MQNNALLLRLLACPQQVITRLCTRSRMPVLTTEATAALLHGTKRRTPFMNFFVVRKAAAPSTDFGADSAGARLGIREPLCKARQHDRRRRHG